MGLSLGQAPFTSPTSSSINGSIEGSARLVVAGIPLHVDLNAGTAVMMRGSAVRLRVSLDRDALTLHNSVDETVLLDRTRRSIDSLQQRVALMKGEYGRVLSDRPALPGASPVVPDVPQVPGAPAPPGTDSAATHPQAPAATIGSTADSTLAAGRASEERAAHLERRIAQAEQMLDSLGSTEQRLTALVNARKQAPHGLADKLSSVRGLEIGECRSTSSEFLVKDLAVQGVHLQLQRNSVYSDLLYGRSLDDSWRAIQTNGRLVDALQQASLFLPARDLNPRRLGMAVVGYGDPLKDHVQVGVLYGTRYMVAPGVPVPEDAAQLRDLVAEVSTGLAFMHHQYVYLALAGSSTNGSDGTLLSNSDAEHGNTLAGRSGRSLAALMGIRSEWEATHTRLDLEVKVTGPDFYSIGMGYQRPGSRSLSATMSQRIARELDLRIRGAMEDREAPGGTQHLLVERGQLNLNYRPCRSWSLTAQAQPAIARTTGADGAVTEQRNWVLGGGVNYRHRIHHTDLQWSARLDRFSIALPDTLAPISWWASSSLSLQCANGAALAVTYAGPVGTNGTGSYGQLAANTSTPLGKRLRCDVHVTVPLSPNASVGYGAGCRLKLSTHFWSSGIVEHFSTLANYFPTSFGQYPKDGYYWIIKVGYDW